MRTIGLTLCVSALLAGCGGSVATEGVGGASSGATSTSSLSTTNAQGTGSTSTSVSTGTTGGASTSGTSTSTGPTSTNDASSSVGTGTSSNDASSAQSSSSTGGVCAGCQFPGFDCCESACVDTTDDILNCGGCGVKCGGAHPFCDKGTCGTPPCQGIACPAFGFCCGTQCCTMGQICCQVDGGPLMGPKCVDPNANGGTCPKGCPVCN